MAGRFNVLAQVAPPAITETLLFQAPLSGKAAAQELIICNRGPAASFRVSISLLGAATAPKDYIYFDLPISANNTFASELAAIAGLTLNSGDAIRVYSSSNLISFTLFGENT